MLTDQLGYLQAKADSLAHAIAKAEGFGVPDALPTRCNNPGDMKLGDRGWGTVEGKTQYPKADWAAELGDREDGASALRRECLAILVGASHIYALGWDFSALGAVWTGYDNWEEWCKVVCKELGAARGTTLAQYAEKTPATGY